MIGVGISFGGSKVAVGLVDVHKKTIIAQSPRIEWASEFRFDLANPAHSLSLILADEIGLLAEQAKLSVRTIESVGVAWPGPGRYSCGIVEATFVPGFHEPRQLWPLLQHAFQGRLGPDWRVKNWCVRLDACAGAFGEAYHTGGQLRDCRAGCLINIATGIAGALVRDGRPVLSHDEFGEAYGQFGRFLIRSRGNWEWRPTKDGRIPSLAGADVRFTDLCGGPALARRLRGKPLLPRNVTLERQMLANVTLQAANGNGDAMAFLDEVGCDIGEALACLNNAIGPFETVVLAGGVGGNLGRPPSDQTPDLLLQAIKKASRIPEVLVSRSSLGLTAELIGAVLV